MRKVFIVAILATLVGVAGCAQIIGQELDVRWHDYQKVILDEYTTHIEAMKAGHYQGLVRGTVAMLIGAGTIRVPDDSTLVHWCAVVGNYLDEHPED
ncbi:MAG: hypothetical protein ABSG63_14845 [Spirochaetia bacterium]|jgi:hypothetical protein